jgi:hypothetical protein
LHPASGGKVDVFVCQADDQFERARLDRRVRMEMFGVSTWVATAEDVVLSKLRWRAASRLHGGQRRRLPSTTVWRVDHGAGDDDVSLTPYPDSR